MRKISDIRDPRQCSGTRLRRNLRKRERGGQECGILTARYEREKSMVEKQKTNLGLHLGLVWVQAGRRVRKMGPFSKGTLRGN